MNVVVLVSLVDVEEVKAIGQHSSVVAYGAEF